MAEPPSLPYARDEGSTSQPHSAYPAYPVEAYEPHEGFLDEIEEEPTEISAALQYWAAKRHRGKGKAKEDENDLSTMKSWRLKSKLKTVTAGLFICLNIGVDPPDIVKTNPCAKTECWIDPTQLPSNKAIEAIGRNLHQQFETLNPKVKYKPFLDPSIEETKKQCVNMRRSAKDERVVFYYNGHGVPKPTPSGEIWVFNKNYTQYIPVSLYDLQEWLGSPCIYVWECSGAGNILNNFAKSAERRDNEARAAQAQAGHAEGLPGSPYSEALHLAACQANEILPMSPDLPADLFTCCLTSPIETALRHFVLQDPLRRNGGLDPNDPRSRITVDMVMRIPGDLKDRRTPLGELSWIFTAVTDTIAWLSFPREVFNRLFRQDLLVAGLFRNFLLAQRIMSAYHCTPTSIPEIPSAHNHPLWHSWDLAVDACLAQLPELLDLEAAREAGQSNIPPLSVYRPSTFFAQHLQAFEVWLQHGGAVPNRLAPRPKKGVPIPRSPPEQLPIVLQVLLSQSHRLRALILISRFVDLGPWAVHLSLSIGIFPYVQKLLASPAVELKPVLIYIWARILAIDRSCQMDLLRDSGFTYFTQILAPYPQAGSLVIPNANEHRAMSAFILSILCRNFRVGQTACLGVQVFDSCVARLGEDDWLLKTWCLLCIAQLWADYDEAKALFMQSQRQNELLGALRSTAVEVRAAALYAFGTLLGASSAPVESTDAKGGGGTGAQLGLSDIQQLEIEAGLAFACMMSVKEDASSMVRKELVVVISCVVREWRGWLVSAAWAYYEQEAYLSRTERQSNGTHIEEEEEDIVSEALKEWTSNEDKEPHEHQHNLTLLSSFKVLFETLLDLSVDPHTEVALMASTVVDYIIALLVDSAFTRVKGSAIRNLLKKNYSSNRPKILSRQVSAALSEGGKFPNGPLTNSTQLKPPQMQRSNTNVSETGSGSSTLKRSGSVANALRSLASMTGLVVPPDSPDSISSQKEKENEFMKITQPKIPLSENSGGYKSPYPEHGHERILPSSPAPGPGPNGPSRSRSAYGSALPRSATAGTGELVKASSVLEALTAEDMERLHFRRSKGSEANTDIDGRFGNNGLPRSNDLGLGMVAKEVKDDVLPLRSGFFDWAMEYFREPQMKAPDADEPGSTTYNEQAWKHLRNEQMVEDSRAAEGYAATHVWNVEAGTLQNDSWPLQLAFHSYDPVIAVTDDADNVCIWEWQSKRRLNKFSNQNIPGSSISSVHFINEMASSLMLTASTEGSIRIFRDYETPNETALASTFRAVSEIHPVAHSSGVLTAWEQQKGHLLVGGDMKVVRLWDATVERHLRDIATQAGANLTAIASDEPEGNVFVAGFGDGVVRLFDKRAEDAGEVVLRTWRQHKIWIQSVHLQRGSMRELVTGSMDGEVRVWDVRKPDEPLYTIPRRDDGLMALAVHTGASVLARTSALTSHSTRQELEITGFSDPLHPIRLAKLNLPTSPAYNNPLHSHRINGFMPSAASLVFHPVEMMIAAGGFDASGTVRLYKCPTPKSAIATWEQMNGNGSASNFN
ncbi:WD-repeat protein mip1 [Kwoniella mangroviensis CBS 10435]|uniref:WD-repeat protein mip1 n=1 Tax=Kwoniella mangroviensis CBS 10435 TaxID=1331196 RepID=A0A1B9IHM9_9TREE|nr:WD-repeat protein mip1 [Kwoniella mangroviensis CBS 10435]